MARLESVPVAPEERHEPGILRRLVRKAKEVGRVGAIRTTKARHEPVRDDPYILCQLALEVIARANWECSNSLCVGPKVVDVPPYDLTAAPTFVARQPARQAATGRAGVHIPALLKVNSAERTDGDCSRAAK